MKSVSPFSSASDVIAFKSISTGGNSAGNGGDGYNKGDLSNTQTASFDPVNKAYGADVTVKTGDHVSQKAGWDAGGAKVHGSGKDHASADATSNGSQKSSSGHDTSKVTANTDATQENWVKFDQSSVQKAGIGGDGGDHNYAGGGDVSFALVHSDSYPGFDFGHDMPLA
ncbi:hypothetical protein ABEG18_23690 [Alsobacter sp. KACC 23698]|uniref:PE-PGRS family protein n=1 Tax=Alsobacter sp. KACC 23698 TaxID=3149229 RepID=A0AAU7JEN0_9HYPH